MMFVVREMYRHAQLFLEVEPLTGRRHVEVGERRTRRDWALWIQGMLRTRYPQAERVVLILDNLNTHGIESLYETIAPQEARTLAECLEIHYTPKHGQLATPFDGLGLRVNSRLTCPPVTVRSSRDGLDPDEVGGACNHKRSAGSARCTSPGRRMDSTAWPNGYSPPVTVRSGRDGLDPDEVGGACNRRRSAGFARPASPGRRMDSTA